MKGLWGRGLGKVGAALMMLAVATPSIARTYKYSYQMRAGICGAR